MKKKNMPVETPIADDEIITEIVIDILGGTGVEKKMNEFLHATDVFEKSKHLVTHERITMRAANPNILKICETVATAYNHAGGYTVFVGIHAINGQKAESSHAWIMPNVNALSMNTEQNQGWGLFKDILDQLGYTAETDKHMHVISVK